MFIAERYALVTKAPEGRYVYSNVENLHTQAPEGRHVFIVNTRNKGTFTNNSEPIEVSEVPLTRGI